ncbi:glycosyltransferase [Pseudomonas sp. RIT-PI-AD]|uniref:glycosyltransferase n=1 Tax=Pseudomonas sp. RIT-PI-AD TaxID=3035294 RepID=UPI0021DAB03C|nr:glycosyltransferase [Pseudomonas sp. RIT-PI-AD]
MISLALVTPWPPQETGIADYCFDLAAGLLAHDLAITVYTDAERPRALPGVRIEALEEAAARLDDFDVVVYQMGNNVHFHGKVPDLLAEHPGIVHLHDFSLHHLFAHAWANGDEQRYFEQLRRWYGAEVLDTVLRLLDQGFTPWSHPLVLDMPLSEEVIQHATAYVVHSRFAHRRLRQRLPQVPGQVIPQLYRDARPRPFARSGPLRIGMFGLILPHRRPELVLEALRQLRDDPDLPAFTLDVGGALSSFCAWLPERLAEYGLAELTRLHGRLDDEAFVEKIAEMDLIINLRDPTMGEVSAIAMRAMQHGIPCVVSDVGWYAELPAFMHKVGADDSLGQLTDILRRHLADPDHHRRVREAAIEHAHRALNYEDGVAQFYRILVDAAARKHGTYGHVVAMGGADAD